MFLARRAQLSACRAFNRTIGCGLAQNIQQRTVRTGFFRTDKDFIDPEEPLMAEKKDDFLHSDDPTMSAAVLERSNSGMGMVLSNRSELSHETISMLYRRLRDLEVNTLKRVVCLTSVERDVFGMGLDVKENLMLTEAGLMNNHKALPFVDSVLDNRNDLTYLVHTYFKPLVIQNPGHASKASAGLWANSLFAAAYKNSSADFDFASAGLAPSLGASSALLKAPVGWAEYLLLTGAVLDGPMLYHLNIASRWMSRDAVKVMELTSENTLRVSEATARTFVEEHALEAPEVPKELLAIRTYVAQVFDSARAVTTSKMDAAPTKAAPQQTISPLPTAGRRRRDGKKEAEAAAPAAAEPTPVAAPVIPTRPESVSLILERLEAIITSQDASLPPAVRKWAEDSKTAIMQRSPVLLEVTLQVVKHLREYKADLLQAVQASPEQFEQWERAYKLKPVAGAGTDIDAENQLVEEVRRLVLVRALTLESLAAKYLMGQSDALEAAKAYLLAGTQFQADPVWTSSPATLDVTSIAELFAYKKPSPDDATPAVAPQVTFAPYEPHQRSELPISMHPKLRTVHPDYNKETGLDYDPTYMAREIKRWSPGYLKAEMDKTHQLLTDSPVLRQKAREAYERYVASKQ